MNFEKYKIAGAYPGLKPQPPEFKGSTAAEALTFAQSMADFEATLATWRAAKKVYSDALSEKMKAFKTDALEECGLTGHPRAEKAFAMAWERGHDSGLSSVYGELQELAELLAD